MAVTRNINYMDYDLMPSPLGDITIATDGQAITRLHIAGDRYFTGVPAGWTHRPQAPLLRQARAELVEYFAGSRTRFAVPAIPSGTAFQRAVWAALATIPPGTTASYADIAQVIGRPTAARAVGTAIGRNPVCLLIPCHRVVASNGGFGGYVAGLSCKQYLLRLEGVSVAGPSATP